MSDYVVTFNGRKFSVSLNNGDIEIDGKKISGVSHSKINGNLNLLKMDNFTFEIPTIVKDKSNFTFVINGLKYDVTARTKLEEKAREVMKNRAGADSELQVKAPMPGLILSIKKNIGDEIHSGDSLFVLEAMKMENEIRATKDGKIKKILVKEGQSVEKNQVVLIVE